MKQFLNVLKFEYLSVCRNRMFLITSIVFLAVIIVGSLIPSVISVFQNTFGSGSQDSGKVRKILVDDARGAYSDEELGKWLGEYSFERRTVDQSALDSVEAGDYNYALVIDGSSFKLYTGVSDSFSSGPMEKVEGMVKEVSEKNYLAEKGLNSTDIQGFMDLKIDSEMITLGKNFSYTFWYAYILLFMLYFTILMYGQTVVTSVATEKSTKTMELLITSVKPSILMFGKVIGAGLAGLTQFAMFLIVGFIMLRLNLNNWIGLSAGVGAVINFALSSNLIVFVIIFFILGFFQFAFLYAGFGSTISRLEEASTVITIPMMIFIGAFLVSMLGMTSGASAGYVKVLSFVPLFSPLVMFMRMCVTDVQWIEVAISIIINTVALFLAGVISARIYKVGVMLYGNPPKISTIVKYMIKG